MAELPPPLVGNGRAVSLRIWVASAALKLGRTEAISPTMPLTIGAEKLVPTEAVPPV